MSNRHRFCPVHPRRRALPVSLLSAADGDRYWPQWRGPEGTGVSRLAKPPLEWSETKNIRWKKEIPGRGSGTPVIWGDLLFLSTAVPVGVNEAEAHAPRGKAPGPHKYWCWRSTARTAASCGSASSREDAPHEATHQDWGTWASPSVVTDGTHVDRLLRVARHLRVRHEGHASLAEGSRRQVDARCSSAKAARRRSTATRSSSSGITRAQSFIVALDKRTGEERWRTARDEIDSWATPLIVENGRPRASRHQRHEASAQLRPRDRQGSSGMARARR